MSKIQILECERLPFLGKKCPFYTADGCAWEMSDDIAPVKEMNRNHIPSKDDENVQVTINLCKSNRSFGFCTKVECPIYGKIITEWELMG